MILRFPNENRINLNIYDCLNEYFYPTGESKFIEKFCLQCNNIRLHTHSVLLQNFPYSILLVLSRYGSNSRLIDNLVEIPQVLRLDNYVEHQVIYDYELSSIIYHQGDRIYSGHITCNNYYLII